MEHISVLTAPAIDGLRIDPNATIVDCTLGSGGHAREILTHLRGGTLIALDQDPSAIADNAALAESKVNTVHLVNRNFRHLGTVLDELTITQVDGIVADLGWRIEQFTSGGRGFSFQADEPLHMTYGDPATYSFTAQDIVNDWAEGDIANVIYGYGEERYARRIARAIVTERTAAPIETARQLATIIERTVPTPARFRKTHPATKTFQALRIAVNDEWDALTELLQQGLDRLRPGGRFAVITFHSAEDRIVKETFKTFTRDHLAVAVTKKPIAPTAEEVHANPRARSAKLRIIERL